MAPEKKLFSHILDERITYRLVLSFALMSVIPMLLTTYMIVTMWLPDLALWVQISVLLLLGLSVSTLGYLLSRTVVYTILKTSREAKQIAEGDLSKRLEIRNEQSEMNMLVQSFNQITTQLEEKIQDLKLSEEKYRHLVENVPDLLYYLDPEGNISSVNEEVSQLLGYDKEELLGKPFSAIVHDDDYRRYQRILRERRTDEQRLTKGLRIRLRAKNGCFHIFEINSRGIYAENDDFRGTEGLARDITAQLALETEREELLYMLTHDIKNPVSAILFIVYMMRDGTIPSSKYAEYYDKIETACNGVVRLVEDFLEYKKLEYGSMTLDSRKINVFNVLYETVRTYGSEAHVKGKTLTIDGMEPEQAVEGKILIAEVDEKYFQRVIGNLVTNAIKFAKKSVDMGLRTQGENVLFHIRDDGPGVPDKEKQDIFNLFHTRSGSRIRKGIGVGLASAQKIVQAHGGHLWVESDNGGGCSFFVSIPLSLNPKEPPVRNVSKPAVSEPAEAL